MVSHSSEGPRDATGPGSGPGSASSAGALPRSALLALWLRAARLGDEDGLARLLRAVQRDDEPHVVSGALGDLRLEDLAGAWAGDAREVVALAPVPGDVTGVPPEAAARATDAGECVVVTTSSGSWALVPEVTEFGSDLEPGHLVTWHVTSVGPWSTRVLGALGSLAEAERDLRTALLLATRALDELDVARWRDDAAGAIADLRAGGAPTWQLPATVPPRAVQVLTQAVRLRAIVDLATADDGGSVNLWQADQRSTALREVDRASRHAVGAATLWIAS
ncbi:hypothetical protein JOE63_002699 [Cellulosimicrobium cellulans]|uniref:hypothetical protein n=1 Tax=Cellulosimicrobium cellulans TaxID=1710 RepID=UPI0027DCB11F|nr:hypothetical protein [Cellulosimicrobium cellulans]MBM7820222.1 hypothetical protein [Cellulosimicrobium cellulans]